MKLFILRCFVLCVFIAYAAVLMAAGYVGIDLAAGPWWAAAALGMTMLLRFSLPVTVGAFYGAIHVWQWHWAPALVFAAPGLVFMLPGVVPAIFSLATQGGDRLTNATPVTEEH
jgi:uncharacterized membrane protein YjjB (DUF3815 family)